MLAKKSLSSWHRIAICAEPNSVVCNEFFIYAFNIFPTHTIWRIIFFAARRNYLIHLIWPKASRSIIGRSPRPTRIIVWIFISLLLFLAQWQFVPCLLKQFFVLNIKQDVVMTITKCRTHIGRCTLLPHYVCNKVLAAKYLVANHF